MSKKKIQVHWDKKRKEILRFFGNMLVAFIVTVVALGTKDIKVSEHESIGIELVKALYDFKDVYQLDSNMVIVKELTTEPVFNDLTIDNEQRTLTTYLKFNNKPCTVHIIDNTDSYVMYRLENENISSDRIFVFFFKVDKDGKVNWYKEVEGIEFVNTIY